MKTLARRFAVPVELNVYADARLPEAIEVGAYYVVSEALANAAKHAHASAIAVDVVADDGVLRVAVRDDGHGGRLRKRDGPRGPQGSRRGARRAHLGR